MSKLTNLLWAILATLVAMPAMAQGVVVFKKDGSCVVFPYETIDSIVTYNYDETPPTGGNTTQDGENKVYTVNGVSFTMVAVKGGTFTMGATAEQTGADLDEFPICIFLAVPQLAVVMFPVPSKLVPLIVLAVANFVADVAEVADVAVVALPCNAPLKVVAVSIPAVVSKYTLVSNT
mgnify:CR=1 FL=1